ncbi:MAG: hypothetical protein V2J89_09895 [Halieaceae bacterium]|jgi:hypothetical protein|nr:hypothetical protein [Halieaceae bacterium]
MKLLLVSTDRALLLEKAALLQGCGIPVHLEDIPHAGAVPSHLYVVFDRHLEDARALLEDASHCVAQPVYQRELDAIADEVRAFKLGLGQRLLESLLFGLLVVMAVCFVGARVFG